MLNFYDNMSFKQKNILREGNYLQFEIEILSSMFQYTGLPFPYEYMEQCLIREGVTGIGKCVDGEIIVGTLTSVGNIGTYGLGTEGIVTSWNGSKQARGVIGKDIVRVFNNNTHTPDLYLSWFADMFSQVDLSIYYNVQYARYNPFILVEDNQTKNAIEKALDNMKSGKLVTILMSKVNSILGNKGFEVANISDVKNIDKVQYLSKLHDDLLRRFATMYGQAISSNGKMAQLNEKELEGYDTFSMIIPEDRLEMRKKAIEEINSIFGLSATVDFSTPWKIAYERLKKENVSRETLQEGDNDNGNSDLE